MKKFTIISITAFAALCTACSSADDFADNTTVKEGNVKVTLSATLPSSNTRTVLTDGGTGGMTQTWAATDEIKVVNANQSYEAQTFSTTGSGTSKTASFTGSLTNPTNGDQLYAFYPSSLATPAIVGTPTAASVSVDYSSQDGTLAGAASKAVMYAGGTYNSSGSTNLGTFTNAGAILRINMTFPSEVTIKNVVLMANGLVNKKELTLSGTGSTISSTWANPTNGSMTASFTTAQASSSKILTAYMAAIPQSGLRGITVFATTQDDLEYSGQLNTTNEVKFDENKVHTINATMSDVIEYKGTESTAGVEPLDINNDGIIEIISAENLKYLQTDTNFPVDGNYDNSTKGKSYKLMKNVVIDNSINWKSISMGDVYFEGIFDGNNKTVTGFNYNLTSTDSNCYGFFGQTYGSTIKNLTVSGTNITSNANIFAFGGIAGVASESTIEGCKTSFATVSLKGGTIGGICGQVDNTNIYGCSSEIGTLKGQADVSNNIASVSIGGIVGISSENTKIMVCTTRCGEILGSSYQYTYVGGLYGRVGAYADTPTIKGCISYCDKISGSIASGNYLLWVDFLVK